jgi:adenylosuccinate synthase
LDKGKKMIKYADVVIGLSYGDEGKGKVTNSLLKKGEYTHCIRYNGSSNAGHTIYKDGKKFVTHIVPTGIFQGVKSIIGPGCVANVRLLDEEVKKLVEGGLKTKDLLFVDERVNLVSSEHLHEDSKDEKIGSTRRGNGPAYRDKYARKNIRFGDLPWSDPNYDTCDIYNELFDDNENVVLMEGAQAFGLDIDWGDYPYVTSSHCGVGGAIQNGIPYNKIRNVYGVCKAYETYVGNKKFEGDDPLFPKIREVGQEFGATTGRPRQVGFLDLDNLIRSATINGATHLIVNKIDILEEIGVWKLLYENQVRDLETKVNFIRFITETMTKKVETIRNIYYSSSPEDI